MNIYKRYRIDNHLTQQEIADACGVTQACWSSIETSSRKLTIDTISRIINGTELTFEELLRDYRKGLRARTKGATRPNRRTRATNSRAKN